MPSLSLRKWYMVAYSASGNAMPSLANMLFDCRHKRIEVNVFEKFRSELVKMWKQAETEHKTQRPEELIPKAIDRFGDSLYCKGPIINPVEPATLGISRVMDADSFYERNVYKNSIGHKTSASTSSKRAIKRLETYHLKGSSIRQDKDNDDKLISNQMRGGKMFAWVTPTASLENLRGLFPNENILAHQVRDQLALVHFARREYLIEICYPKRVVERLLIEKKLRAPTFIEGCPNLIYRSSNTDTEGWGRTVDLSSSDLKDGLPEAICPPVDFNEHFRILGIGQLDRTSSVSWNDYLNCHPVKPTHDSYKELDAYAP